MSGFETQTRTQATAGAAAQAQQRTRDAAAPGDGTGTVTRDGTGAGHPSRETGTPPAHAALLGAYWLDGPPHGTHTCDRCRRLLGPSGQEVVRTVMLGLAVVTIVWGALMAVAVG
ncbi:hypothetical protein [Streptomyces sp. NRRL S-118]|uniref:hypothetical protein n=1 Tax=Streptomyces sp. NRRL S-118 TaxID=1463881 RepID=UPI0004C612A8|nr:hypothetical protein [Streptomyces sp. NRRL S-118]